MATLGANACNRLSRFKMIEIKLSLFNFIQMRHVLIKAATVMFESLHFLSRHCIKKEDKSCDESGFGGSKKFDFIFFHNPEFIVSQ